mgnify:CR=1 FL=1
MKQQFFYLLDNAFIYIIFIEIAKKSINISFNWNLLDPVSSWRNSLKQMKIIKINILFRLDNLVLILKKNIAKMNVEIKWMMYSKFKKVSFGKDFIGNKFSGVSINNR